MPTDLKQGVPTTALPDGGMLAGEVDGEPVLLVRRGEEIFAIGATCTHYGGPLGQGLVVGATIRCPWHHACFDLRTGEPLRAPALNPVPAWNVERRADRIAVAGKRVVQAISPVRQAGLPVPHRFARNQVTIAAPPISSATTA